MTGENDAPPLLPGRSDDAHKYACGRVLVVAGSVGMLGAGALASRAAFRSGVGLVNWAVPRSLVGTASMACLEAIVLPVPETEGGAPSMDAREHLVEAAREAHAALIGPGLPAAGETGELIRLDVPEFHAPLVVDAGALSAIGPDGINIFGKRRAPTVITPHEGEMARLTGQSVESIHAARVDTAKAYAAQTGAVVVLKGRGTVVTDGARTWINPTGNPGMATAGAGDVLAGVILALLGQKMDPYGAARLAAWLHGRAGDLARARVGMHGLMASDILAHLPAAFLERGGA